MFLSIIPICKQKRQVKVKAEVTKIRQVKVKVKEDINETKHVLFDILSFWLYNVYTMNKRRNV